MKLKLLEFWCAVFTVSIFVRYILIWFCLNAGCIGCKWLTLDQWCDIFWASWNYIKGSKKIKLFRKLSVLPYSLLTLSGWFPAKGWRRKPCGCQFIKSFNCQLWQWFTCKKINNVSFNYIYMNCGIWIYVTKSICMILYVFRSLFNGLQVIDLARVSQELAYLASDADLVVLEGMVSSSLGIIGNFLHLCWVLILAVN